MSRFYYVLAELGGQEQKEKTESDIMAFNHHKWFSWKVHHHYIYSASSGDSDFYPATAAAGPKD